MTKYYGLQMFWSQTKRDLSSNQPKHQSTFHSDNQIDRQEARSNSTPSSPMISTVLKQTAKITLGLNTFCRLLSSLALGIERYICWSNRVWKTVRSIRLGRCEFSPILCLNIVCTGRCWRYAPQIICAAYDRLGYFWTDLKLFNPNEVFLDGDIWKFSKY